MRSAVLIFFLFSSVSHAAIRYVRQGAVGNGSGSDWANAYTNLPPSLVRGDTYFIADGTYSNHAFNDEPSGLNVITIKKCTLAEHGTDVGYNSTYCDGKSAFTGGFSFTRPYYVIDGSIRNENNWKDHASYGFSIPSFYASRLAGGHLGGDCSADNITIRNVHVGNTSTSFASRNGEFYISGFGGGSVACENWTISRVLAQNMEIGIQCAGCKGLLVEYSHFYIGWAKESIRGQVHASNMTIRWSVFEDSCQRDPNDPTSGCTAEIAAWDGSNSGDFDNIQIYGNVFYKTTTEHNSGGVIVAGGNGVSWVGVAANNARIYNNTIAGFRQGTVGIVVNGGTSNECRNNAWYDIAVGVGTGANCGTVSTNAVISGNPFINYSIGNFRLAGATIPGTSLSAPYNVDMIGIARGSGGVWDIGAFEFGGTAPPPPTGKTIKSTPTMIRVTN